MKSGGVNTYNYTYGDSNRKDKLTNYNEKNITYDAIENPLTYNGWNYIWKDGRQLSGVSGNGYTISYKYNDSGIRTEKPVNGVTSDYRLNGVKYYYIRNGQNDIIGLIDGT